MDNEIKQLDYAAFKKLFENLYPALCRHSIQLVHNSEVAEDIVQEQFIYLWENRLKISIYKTCEGYLYKAVRNKSIDYLRSKYVRIKFEDNDNFIDVIDDKSIGVLGEIQENEQIEMITKAIECLPEKCQIIFSMSRFSDLSNKEIAEKLSVSEKTVENQITIAIKKIKSFLLKDKFLSILF